MCGSHKSPTEPHHSVRFRESTNHFFSLCPREKKSVNSKRSALFIVTFNIRIHVRMLMNMHTCMHTAHGLILMQTGPMHLTCADCARQTCGHGSQVLVVEEGACACRQRHRVHCGTARETLPMTRSNDDALRGAVRARKCRHNPHH